METPVCDNRFLRETYASQYKPHIIRIVTKQAELTQFNKVNRFKKHKISRKRLREPDLLIVLTGGEMAYTRDDGVKVIPIGCLRD